MSTKAIKQLARLCRDEGYTPEIQKMGADALAEVEAIQRAAKGVTTLWAIPKLRAEAMALMDSIAKEEP